MKKKAGFLTAILLVVAAVFLMGADYSWNKEFGATLGKDGRSWSNLFLKDTITFEGATSDGSETTISVTEPTADRTWTLPDKSATFQSLEYTILDKNTNYTVLSADAGKVITNAGTSTLATMTLPEASTVIGKPFIFAVATAQSLAVDVATGDQIVSTTNAAGDMAWADAAGESITLVAIDNTNFVELSKTGTWSDGN